MAKIEKLHLMLLIDTMNQSILFIRENIVDNQLTKVKLHQSYQLRLNEN